MSEEFAIRSQKCALQGDDGGVRGVQQGEKDIW